MAKSINSIAKTPEEIFSEKVFVNLSSVQFMHYLLSEKSATYLLRPNGTPFSLKFDASYVSFSETVGIDDYLDVFWEISSKLGEPVLINGHYAWRTSRISEQTFDYASRKANTDPKKSIEDKMKSEPINSPVTEHQSKKVIAAKMREIVRKSQKIVPSTSLETYLQEGFGSHEDLSFFAYDGQKHGILFKHKMSRKFFEFGVGFNGKCVFYRQTNVGLDTPPDEAFVKDIAQRLGTSKYEFNKFEKAQIWYVDGLVDLFPELKN